MCPHCGHSAYIPPSGPPYRCSNCNLSFNRTLDPEGVPHDSWREIARELAYALIHRRSSRCGGDERLALKKYACATKQAGDANSADEWWYEPWLSADLCGDDSLAPNGNHPDRIALKEAREYASYFINARDECALKLAAERLRADDAEGRVKKLTPDYNRLSWLLDRLNKKGFDDLACGICTRKDVDAAMKMAELGITPGDIHDTNPPRVGWEI